MRYLKSGNTPRHPERGEGSAASGMDLLDSSDKHRSKSGRSFTAFRITWGVTKSVICYVLLWIVLITSVLVFFLTTTQGLSTLIQLASICLPGQLSVQHIDGSLIKKISFTELTYSDPKLDVHIIRGHVAWTMLRDPWHLNVILNDVHMKKLHIHRPQVTSTKELEPQDIALPTIPFNIYINQLMIDELAIAQIKAQRFQLTASINNSHWSIQHLKTQYHNQTIDLQGQGQLQQPYDLSATLNIKPVSPLINGVTGQFKLSGDKACYRWKGQFAGWAPLTVNGTLTHVKQLDATLSMGMNRLTITGDILDKLHINAYIPQPQDIHPAFSDIKTTLNITGDISGSRQGSLNIAISPGVIQQPKPSSIPTISFQGGRVSLALTPEALQATGELSLDPNETIKASLHLPEFDWRRVTSLSQPLEGTMSLSVNSLDFLKGLSPVLNNPHGQLSANLILKGSLGNPDVQGTLKLIDAGVSFPDAGVILNPIQATLISHNKHWDVEGSLGGENGHVISIKGQGEFLPRLVGSVMINADDFSILKTPEYAIDVSPQLTIKIDQDALDITGVMQVPTARFKPQLFSNTLNLTNDAVFVDSESVKAPSLVHVKANVLLKVGPDVMIDAQGLQGMLGGDIQLIQSLDGSMSALGELRIRNGTYKAYGQDLAINQGQLLFAGANPGNPNLSLRAVRTFNNTSQFSGSNQLFDFNASNLQSIDFGNHVTVGIDVSGYLSSPKIKLFSVPSSMSQADILSMLLLGKPANQASQSGGQLLLTAISAMNLDSGTQGMQLLSQLKQTLGFDFDVKSSSISNQASNTAVGDTAFVVGKALSKRLYLSYSIGILQENSNVLILKYLLNKYFSIQVTASSTENGVDLLYSTQP